MASGFYDKGRQGFAGGDIAWDTDDIRVILCTSGYVRNIATDEFLSSITAGQRVAMTAADLASKTFADGVLDGADVVYTALTGSAVSQIVVVKYTGADATSRLILNYDDVSGFPFTPSGLDVTLQWSNGATKMGKL